MSSKETQVVMNKLPDVFVKETPEEVFKAVNLGLRDAANFICLHDSSDNEIYVDPRSVSQIQPYDPPEPFVA